MPIVGLQSAHRFGQYQILNRERLHSIVTHCIDQAIPTQPACFFPLHRGLAVRYDAGMKKMTARLQSRLSASSPWLSLRSLERCSRCVCEGLLQQVLEPDIIFPQRLLFPLSGSAGRAAHDSRYLTRLNGERLPRRRAGQHPALRLRSHQGPAFRAACRSAPDLWRNNK